ncbi:hypothetical protein KP509_36G048600 [Ceratopteris richardii]|nr:hypothetical protein KP509_36G048600 [Ceratopteris richardii]
MLFNWAESVNWSWHDVAKACTDAEKAKRNKAYNSLNLTPSPAWPPLPEKISSHYHIDGISNPLHGQETSRRGSRAVSHSPARNIQADFYGNQYFYTPSNHADVSRGKRARPSETYPGARKLYAHFPSHMH